MMSRQSQSSPDLRQCFELHRIVIERPDEVADYLIQWPQIASPLPAICAKLRDAFPIAELALSVYKDFEIDDRYLAMYVRFDQYSPGVMEEIELVAAEFDDILPWTTGHLLITTDFRPPRRNDAV